MEVIKKVHTRQASNQVYGWARLLLPPASPGPRSVTRPDHQRHHPNLRRSLSRQNPVEIYYICRQLVTGRRLGGPRPRQRTHLSPSEGGKRAARA